MTEPYESLPDKRYATIEQTDGLLEDADLLFEQYGITYRMLEEPYNGASYHVMVGPQELQATAYFQKWHSCLITYEPEIRSTSDYDVSVRSNLVFYMQRYDTRGEIEDQIMIDFYSGNAAEIKDITGAYRTLQFMQDNPEKAESFIILQSLEVALRDTTETDDMTEGVCLTLGVIEELRQLLLARLH